MISHLLSHTDYLAAVIDITGNLDVLRIYALLVSRLQAEPELLALQRSSSNDGLFVDEVASQILERLKIMRVFDFVGLQEAIEEVKEEEVQRVENKGPAVNSGNGGQTQGRVPSEAPRKEVIGDSEDEESDDEMLFGDETNHVLEPANLETARLPMYGGPVSEMHGDDNDRRRDEYPKTLVLIDSLASVTSPLLKNNFTQGTLQMDYKLAQSFSLELV